MTDPSVAVPPSTTEVTGAASPQVITPVVEVAPPSSEPIHPADTPTFLETLKVTEPQKAPEVEAKPPEPAPSKTDTDGSSSIEAVVEPAKPVEPPAPVEYKYTLPETLRMDDASRVETHAAFDAFRANPSSGAQGLIDLHNKQMLAYAKELSRQQIEIFNNTRAEWVKEIHSDPLIGGSGLETAKGVIARMRDKFVSDARPGTPQYETDMADFNRMLRITGVGEHPIFNKMLYRVGNVFDEPSVPSAPAKPPKDIGKPPVGRFRDVYNHPSSNRS